MAQHSGRAGLVGSLTLAAIAVLVVALPADEVVIEGVPVTLDREETQPGGEPLNPATQSVNRRHSVLRQLGLLDVRLSGGRHLEMTLRDATGERRVEVKGLRAEHLVPLLPYSHENLDAFDAANLMLAEYARNGVNMSHQADNDRYAVFFGSAGVFTEGEEYSFDGSRLSAKPSVLPKRLGVTNNCLAPTLWELSATDSVGEMYHAWFDMPRAPYLAMVRAANDLDVEDSALDAALEYKKILEGVVVDLDRLRAEGDVLVGAVTRVVGEKSIGGYSSQDSRRKVQQGYARVFRGGAEIDPKTFAELQAGDEFRLHSFVPPGVYTEKKPQVVPYDPRWSFAEIRSVAPRTRYAGGASGHGELGHVQLRLTEEAGSREIVVGNIPVALLVTQEDYPIPAFGVGVLPPSELIERRTLRVAEGPAPHFAYLVERVNDELHLLNNHEVGLEQVFLRPFERDGELKLRITLVAYERIADLLEIEVPLGAGQLAARIRRASADYEPPLFRVYRDENIL